MEQTPQKWIEKVEDLVAGSQEIPMWGAPPPFPWDQLSEKLATNFQLSDLKISPGRSDWKQGDAVLAGMGENPLQLSIELTPLAGSVYFIVPKEDVARFSMWAIDSEIEEAGFSDDDLQTGFFRYLVLEAMQGLTEIKALNDLTPKLTDISIPLEKAYCIDISCKNDKQTIWGRLVCPPEFQQAYKNHFATQKPSKYLKTGFEVLLRLQAGSTSLSFDEWKSIQEGDFLILDHCTYNPHTQKGTFELTLEKSSLFHVKLKDEKIKILDYATYYEEAAMVGSIIENFNFFIF